jgi:hypothetical protein
MSKLDYPTSTVIYSKDSCVKQHKRCFFNAINVRADYNQIIEYVIWEHCGKGSGAFWTETYPLLGGKTRFCLQDIKNICDYNNVQYELLESSVILEEIHCGLNMEVKATITERDNQMYIKWVYRPYMLRNSITPIIHMNEVCTEEHLITVLDMEQLKQMFDFNKV